MRNFQKGGKLKQIIQSKFFLVFLGIIILVFAFNMLGGHPAITNESESNIWYTDSLDILKYCMTLTRRVILRHHYHPHDFTIFMYKVKKD